MADNRAMLLSQLRSARENFRIKSAKHHEKEQRQMIWKQIELEISNKQEKLKTEFEALTDTLLKDIKSDLEIKCGLLDDILQKNGEEANLSQARTNLEFVQSIKVHTGKVSKVKDCLNVTNPSLEGLSLGDPQTDSALTQQKDKQNSVAFTELRNSFKVSDQVFEFLDNTKNESNKREKAKFKKVRIVNVEGPEKIHVRFDEDEDRYLKFRLSIIKESLTCPLLLHPIKNQMVLVKTNELDWERGVVKDSSEEEVKLKLVDIGMIVRAPKSSIHVLSRKLKSQESFTQCLRLEGFSECSVHDVKRLRKILPVGGEAEVFVLDGKEAEFYVKRSTNFGSEDLVNLASIFNIHSPIETQSSTCDGSKIDSREASSYNEERTLDSTICLTLSEKLAFAAKVSGFVDNPEIGRTVLIYIKDQKCWSRGVIENVDTVRRMVDVNLLNHGTRITTSMDKIKSYEERKC